MPGMDTPHDEARALAAKLRGIDDAEASIAEELAASPNLAADDVRLFVETLTPETKSRMAGSPPWERW